MEDGHWRWQEFAREVGCISQLNVNNKRGPEVRV